MPNNPPLLANSSAIISRWLSGGLANSSQLYPDHISIEHDGTSGFSPVYYARKNDPKYTLNCTEKSWGTCTVQGVTIPIPVNALPAGGSDRHLTVVDQTQTPVYVYDLWQAQNTPLPPAGGATLNVTWGGRSRIDGMGTSEGCSGQGNAAHFSNLAGVIRIDELASGHIAHALSIVVSCTNGDYVPPAKGKGLACSTTQNAPPMGARVHLKMSSAEVEALHIPRWKKTILHAMSQYGAFINDTGTNGLFHFQYEAGIQYLSQGYDDPWWTFAQSQGWTPYLNALVGHWDRNADNMDWLTQIWSKLEIVSPTLSVIPGDPTCR